MKEIKSIFFDKKEIKKLKKYFDLCKKIKITTPWDSISHSEIAAIIEKHTYGCDKIPCPNH